MKTPTYSLVATWHDQSNQEHFVTLTDYGDGSSSLFRIERLRDVLNYVCKADGGVEDYLTHVTRLHDHKGILQVQWDGTATLLYNPCFVALRRAWSIVGNELAENVAFYRVPGVHPAFVCAIESSRVSDIITSRGH